MYGPRLQLQIQIQAFHFTSTEQHQTLQQLRSYQISYLHRLQEQQPSLSQYRYHVNVYGNASQYVSVILPHLVISVRLVVAVHFNSDYGCLYAHGSHSHRVANSQGTYLVLLIHSTFHSIHHHPHSFHLAFCLIAFIGCSFDTLLFASCLVFGFYGQSQAPQSLEDSQFSPFTF